MSSLLRRTLVIIGLYTILALLLTYPLITHFTTHVAGTDIWAFDEYTFLWNIWWFKYSLLDLHTNPLFTDYIFYPLGISLALYTYNLFNALVSLPLQPFLNLATISNLTLIFALVFSGHGTYLLVLYLLRHRSAPKEAKALANHCAAFLAGALYAFGSYRFVYAALGHYDMITTQWIPFYALFMVKTVREQGLRNSVLAGLFATLALLSEMIFGVFLLFLTVIYLLFARREMNGRLMKRLALLVAVVVVTYFPLGYPIVRELLSADYALQGWGHSENLLVDLFGFTTPTALHPLLGSDWARELTMVREGTARFIDVNTVYLGWVAIILGIAAAVKYWPELKAWVVSAATFALLCLGPLLHINGRSTFDLDGLLANVPLPFIILHYIPIVKANRVPNRFSVVLMLALAVLVGFAAYGILRRMKRRSLLLAGTALLWILLSFEHLALPLPLTDARVPDFYYTLAAEPGDFAILQFPLGWRNSFGVLGAERTQIQYYQSVHKKRMLGGNISRNPPFKFDYFQRIFGSIADLELYGEATPEQLERDRALAPDLLYFFDIRYIIFHPSIPGRPPYIDIRPRLEEYVQRVFPVRKVLDEDGFTVYAVEQPSPPRELTIDFGIEEARIYQGEGWSWDEVLDDSTANWATQKGARFFAPLRESGDYTMHIRAKAFSYPGSPPQRVTVRVNGHSLPSQEANPGWTELTLQVPVGFLHPGLNQVALDFAYLASPRDVFPGDFAVGETGVTSPVEIDINSSQEFAYITVGGEDASLHRRGYNLAVIDPQGGKVIDKAGFDTWDSESESQALADFIAAIPESYIVVAALKEGGTRSLTEEAVKALASLGSEIDLRGTEYLSHAIIGVKGAAPGTALEATGEGNSYLHVGKNPDERTLALAVDFVSLVKR